ncbi:protein kinase domain-containing protein [Candidatus Thiodiazotropha sp. CDECU1]|uniref:protein kinase domain-containing protein n=1 Tax=Candidatus Thiodiazotropha sp. CDECU1 TaxID=3065865 RepID=UPI00292E9244|nr:HDOD domain-containing protein [Candidatus Thiodiazotropha sp. CDECU1]
MKPKKIGRFQVGEQLGVGNQGTVYLCHDSQLERKVAIKLLNKSLQESAFQDEARAASKLQHANIVSIYEAGEHQQVPYLVFEYAQGDLLKDLINGQPLELGDALQIFQGLLEGMSQAHKAGIVHRDLKPANIVINKEKVPKIMDFGIARQLSEARGPDQQLIGTPRYLAPEYIQKGEVGPQADVFALGLILDEMLTGMPVFSGHKQQIVIDAILKLEVKPPSQFNSAVDEKLDSFILKSLEKDPVLRYSDATEMLQTFNEMRGNKGEKLSVEEDASGTVEFLLRRMKRKSDFPALSQSVRSINAMADASNKDVNQMAGVIVNDFALTNKILKVVNSAYYGRFSGRIGTVSRAVVVLGTQAIRSLAASLIFFEHIENKQQAEHLRELVSSAMFRATLAHKVAGEIDQAEAEAYFLTGLLNDLGKLLVAFYLPDESKEIERSIKVEGKEAVAAQHAVLGVSYEKIGIEIAGQWNFPKSLIDSMKCWQGEHKPVNRLERRRLVTAFADDAMTAMVESGLDDTSAMEAITKKYAKGLNITNKQVSRFATQSIDEFQEIAKAISSDISDQFVKKLTAKSEDLQSHKGVEKSKPKGIDKDGLGETQILDEEGTQTVETTEAGVAAPTTPEDAETLLMDGLQEVTGMLVGNHSVSEIFNVVLETMYRAVGFQRVVLALLDRKRGEMVGRLGFGDTAEEFVKLFHFPTTYKVDVFHGALKNAVDVYIADTTEDKIQADIPEWYKKISSAGSFLLFPLVVNNRAVGLIYADHSSPRGLEIDKKRLNLLKSLRNQIVLAVRS